ncbi:MAG TPA: VWA domain-containing protein, partial [Minicystis sp.]|nr:VWA domain-containing protein [Minicystis sp.]
VVSGATAAIERAGAGSAKVYVVTEELTVRAAGAEQTVRAGDTATVAAGKVTVAPERGFDDWTGGMAAPWGANGAPRRAVGELWGRPASDPAGSAGSPLTIRAHDVHAVIDHEVARSEAKTTFFNAGSNTVLGDYRMALPPGAIVTRFATIRGQDVREGHVALAARRQSALVASGEVLEWAGDGWVRATIPNIASGQSVAVLVEYVEWLEPRPRDGGKLVVEYRYPMASSEKAPLVGELFARVDAAPSNPISIASGLGARVSGQAVEVHRQDFRPTADLVVDVEIEPFKAPARLYAAPPVDRDDPSGTVVVRTEAPRAAPGEGVALSLVVDTSASIEPALFDAEKALVEAVLQGLGKRDRVAVLAADQTARPVGPAGVGPADAARKKAILDALRDVAPGGATDLGRALEAGADALPADAPAGMVIYVGDGWPTVGDANVDAVLARLARRPNGSPRLGAVAVGPLVNRFALAALVRGSGPLLEIADSNDAARAAIALLTDAL